MVLKAQPIYEAVQSLQIAPKPERDRRRETVILLSAQGQPFSQSEVGLYKTVVLINRLNLFWGLDWEAVPHFVRSGQDLPDSDFLISCVDTRAARATMARIVSLKSRRFHYWRCRKFGGSWTVCIGPAASKGPEGQRETIAVRP